MPDAVVHVLPPLVDTSTLETPEPVPSVAVPVMVTLEALRVAPDDGELMEDEGGAVSAAGTLTVTLTPEPGVSVLPELSVALDFIV